jgi:glycosyltransferase involved in cell wall biosynthesis
MMERNNDMKLTQEGDRPSRLLVIISDKLSGLVRKGEITDRYYNPGDLFREIHILMTNDDIVAPSEIQRMAGSAKLYVHNLPAGAGLFLSSGGWQPGLMRNWVKKGIELARRISPDLVRTHNNFIEGYLAKEIKAALGIPYIVSLHGVWDRDCLNTPKGIAVKFFRDKLERIALSNADAVIAVYKPILRYAKEYNGKNINLIYNVVAENSIKKKENYKISGPAKLITINRQVREKNPENIIRAIKEIDCTYTIIGDGNLHNRLKDVARRLGCDGKVRFLKAIPNEKLCETLKDFDIMVSHCDYWGTSKTIIEASLAGLPIILNKHPVDSIAEYDGDWLLLCDNTPAAYKNSIERLMKDESLRIRYGQNAYMNAMENFEPGVMEKKVVDLYKSVIGKHRVRYAE